MPFWRRQKKEAPRSKSKEKPSTITIMHSETLGMTVIEDAPNKNAKFEELSPEEWVEIIDSNKLNGYSFEKIYFSFLKGIPTYLRFKIWLLLCAEGSPKGFKYTAQGREQFDSSQQIDIAEFSLQIYHELANAQPKQKELDQIEKDIHRSYANRPKYRYTSKLLRKLLVALSNSGVQYSQGMNYILVNIIIYCLDSLNLDESSLHMLQPNHEKDMFILLRGTVTRLEQVFGGTKILKVMGVLEQKIAQSVPQILYKIYAMGMDCFSMFSQNYYSIMSYNDPPQEMCKQMMDLFYLVGEKAIHATIIRMLELSKNDILEIKDPEKLQNFVKKDIYQLYYAAFEKDKHEATCLEHFGLCFFEEIEHLEFEGNMDSTE